MQQRPGFVHHQYPDHVCKLRRSLYGLKQAPIQWYKCLTSALQELGFVGSKTNSSLYYFSSGSITTFCLIYVDDLVLTSSSLSFMQQIVTHLTSKFALKDLGQLHYFLGIEAQSTESGLFLTQRKYITDLLTKANMLSAKGTSTPSCVT